jgi:hypothetical protein
VELGDVELDFVGVAGGDALEGGIIELGGVEGDANTVKGDSLFLCQKLVCAVFESDG